MCSRQDDAGGSIIAWGEGRTGTVNTHPPAKALGNIFAPPKHSRSQIYTATTTRASYTQLCSLPNRTQGSRQTTTFRSAHHAHHRTRAKAHPHRLLRHLGPLPVHEFPRLHGASPHSLLTYTANMSVLPAEVHTALAGLLQGLQSPDNVQRSNAETQLNEEWVLQRPEVLLMGLSEQIELAQDTSVRQQPCPRVVCED
jgi:hypothetical protein